MVSSCRLAFTFRRAVLVLVLAISAFSAGTAVALERCLALAEGPRFGPRIERVQDLRPFRTRSLIERATLGRDDVRLTFIGHSTFLIESAEGITIATDYNDYVKPQIIPDVVTMNRAHDSHYTLSPEPSIKHVLRGWRDDGGPIEHDIKIGDVRVRNVPTHIRGWTGGPAEFGNSIFIFEVGAFCIAHLGHLHHTLKPGQLAQLGQMDVVLVPVDGTYTLDLDGMIEVLKDIQAPLIIPMHYFSRFTLERFLSRIKDTFGVRENGEPTLVLTKQSLPRTTEVLVLPGR
jgi:L-ascorbate metabolism protein UlaG (beta-lactamase superfamily)